MSEKIYVSNKTYQAFRRLLGEATAEHFKRVEMDAAERKAEWCSYLRERDKKLGRTA